MANELIQNLGYGLVMRRATADDNERLAAFAVRIHSNGTEIDSRGLDAWVRDLVCGNHPTFDVGDFIIVEHLKTGEIISSMNLISQTWTYGGIPFGVGRPELVGTLPEYRRRGLVRIQFEEIHRWSQDRGELVQGITGIPFYYRQFGYEMALNLGGGRYGSPADVPVLPKDQGETYQFIPAQLADIPYILETMAYGNRRYQVNCAWTKELLTFEISQKLELDINRVHLYTIRDMSGSVIGFFGHPGTLDNWKLPAAVYELAPGNSWWEVNPSIMRFLWKKGQEYAQRDGGVCQGVGFRLGESHPAYSSISQRLPVIRRPYAWYLRVADLPGFIRLIGPELERRLAQSDCCGYSGELKISFYRHGLHMAFGHGRMEKVLSLASTDLGDTKAAFPGLSFLQILFGYRCLADLQSAFPDCYSDPDRASPLLNALFPRGTSDLWPIS